MLFNQDQKGLYKNHYMVYHVKRNYKLKVANSLFMINFQKGDQNPNHNISFLLLSKLY